MSNGCALHQFEEDLSLVKEAGYTFETSFSIDLVEVEIRPKSGGSGYARIARRYVHEPCWLARIFGATWESRVESAKIELIKHTAGMIRRLERVRSVARAGDTRLDGEESHG